MKKYIFNNQETQYLIDEEGNCYSLMNKRYLKGCVNSAGYRIYGLTVNGKNNFFYAHRMVAETFIDNNDNEKDCVNHIDGNKLNNKVSNLEWVTKAENNRHAVKTKLNDRTKTVYCYNELKELVAIYDSVKEAAEKIGFCENSICDCTSSKKKTLTCGFYWSHENDNSFETIQQDKRHTKPVGLFSLENELLVQYSSITEASQKTGFSRAKISDCARGKIETYHDYIWKFL